MDGRSPLQVLLCDDDMLFLNQMQTRVQRFLDDCRIPATIHAYNSIASVPECVFAHCDLAVLDIDFPEEKYSGIDLARMLRSARHDATIIFLSNYIEYAPEGYEVQAFRYVLKSEVPQKLDHYLTQALEKRDSMWQTLTVAINRENLQFRLSDIIYIEAQGHAVLLHLPGQQTHRVYSSLGKLEQELDEKGFLRIHKGFLVNMAHIQQFKSTGALLTGNLQIPVSEKNYAALKKKYLLWKGRQ